MFSPSLLREGWGEGVFRSGCGARTLTRRERELANSETGETNAPTGGLYSLFSTFSILKDATDSAEQLLPFKRLGEDVLSAKLFGDR